MSRPLPCTDTVQSGHTGTNPAPPCRNQGQIHLGYTYMHHNQENRSSPTGTIRNWSHENRADMCKHRLWDHTAVKLTPFSCSCTAGKQQKCMCTHTHNVKTKRKQLNWSLVHGGLCKMWLLMYVQWSSPRKEARLFSSSFFFLSLHLISFPQRINSTFEFYYFNDKLKRKQFLFTKSLV